MADCFDSADFVANSGAAAVVPQSPFRCSKIPLRGRCLRCRWGLLQSDCSSGGGVGGGGGECGRQVMEERKGLGKKGRERERYICN